MKTNYRWLLLIAISFMIFIINVDYTAVNLALIPVVAEFHSNLSTMQWLLSGYVLAWSIFVIPAGKYADYYKKKRVCLVGIVLFLFASLIAGRAMSPSVLILARVFQGIAAAIYVPTLYALIYLHFAENERGRAIGLMSFAVGLGMATGPVVGGLFLTWFNWRYIFIVNIPIGLMALFIIYRSKDSEKLQKSIISISKISILLLSSAIVIILYSLSQWKIWPLHEVLYLSLALVAVITIFVLILIQQKIPNPLIPLELFANFSFLGCTIGIMIEQYGFSSVIIATGLYLQKIQQLSSLKSSAIYLPLTALFGVIAVLGGTWVDRVGLKLPILVGLIIMAIGSLFFTFLTVNSDLWFVCFIFSILGSGMGLAFSGLNAGVVKTISESSIGIASSLFLMFALLGNSLGVTLTTMIYEKARNVKVIYYGLGYFNQIFQQTSILSGTVSSLNNGISNAMATTLIVMVLGILCCATLINNTSGRK